MQPSVPAEGGRAEAVTQRQASQRQAAERPLPFPGSGADAFVRHRRNPKFRKAGADAPSVAGGVRRSERRAPMLSSVAGGVRRSEDRQEAAPIREGPCGKVPLRKRPSSGVPLRKRPSPGAPLQERPPPGAPVREGSRGSAPESARKRPEAPRVRPGGYCFGFGCAGRWLSSSSAASSAR